MEPTSHQKRDFAEHVLRRLREARFTAYFAGGCVRDQLLGRTPADYDVATNATPAEIRNVFGRRRTLAIGAAFGVITVLGPKPAAGQVEVATFRADSQYSDGRHPDAVTFSSPEEDARRRDFTVNGLFYDPLDDQVIDFVGGQADLDRRVVRAIGNPHERFNEDKLRLLRAVRFTTTLAFELDVDTADAVRRMAPQIAIVSPERIAAEMRRLLTHDRRAAGVRLLLDTGLAAVILPEIVACDDASRAAVDADLAVLSRLVSPSFPLALATLLMRRGDSEGIQAVGQRWRLANREVDRAVWLAAKVPLMLQACHVRFSEIQPLLVHCGAEELVALAEALEPGSAAAAYGREALRRPTEELDPPPLMDGAALIAHGVRPGPVFSRLLARARSAQLDGEVTTRAEALALIDREMTMDDK
ncbi:MAG: CCA tRNA nucleotidyltransferase [Patescibacteria group bacterium]|nr:CCA tRNA nucleotidyltransferase [Patescibacteria group bacterium]